MVFESLSLFISLFLSVCTTIVYMVSFGDVHFIYALLFASIVLDQLLQYFILHTLYFLFIAFIFFVFVDISYHLVCRCGSYIHVPCG